MSRKILGAAVGGGLLLYGYRYMVDKGKRLSDDQHVVIVGGGYAGVRLAKELKGRGKFTLIDARDSMHHNMAALRAAVEPGFAHKTFIPYPATFGDNFLQGTVVAIDPKNQQVSLENNATPISYSQLVLATGSSGCFPSKCGLDKSTAELKQMYEDFANEVKKAKKIVVVGGGPVGVEIAGEIQTDYPDQKEHLRNCNQYVSAFDCCGQNPRHYIVLWDTHEVHTAPTTRNHYWLMLKWSDGQSGHVSLAYGKVVTIVHNSDVFVSRKLKPKAYDIIAQKFESKHINTMLGDTVTNLDEIPHNKTTEGIKVKLSSGKELDADLVIKCYGLTINTDAYKNALGSSMNEMGQLKVNDQLEVEGVKNIFAIGDCNDFKVTKLATEAQSQATCTYNNLINIAKGNLLQPYKSDFFQMCVPIGRDGGFAQAGSWVLGDFATRKIKATDVFVKLQHQEFGQKPPL